VCVCVLIFKPSLSVPFSPSPSLCPLLSIFFSPSVKRPTAATFSKLCSLAGRELQPQYLWTKSVIENLFDSLLSPYDYFDFLASKVHPAACNGLTCDPICGGHCWDEGVGGCQRCPAGQVLTAGECLLPEDIPDGFYRDDWLARPCRETCASCAGPNDDSCLSCSGNRYLLASPGSSGPCVTNCGQGFYAGSGNVCRRCHVSVRQYAAACYLKEKR
jgi:hypothetical protein